MSFVLPGSGRFYSEAAALRVGSVVAVRWCNGWLPSAQRATAAKRLVLTESLGGCLGKEAKLKEL